MDGFCVSFPFLKFVNNSDLSVGKAVKRWLYVVLCDGVGMINAINSFGHEDDLLLAAHGLHVVPHNVVESSQHAEAISHLYMHGTINIVEMIESFRDEFIAIFQVKQSKNPAMIRINTVARVNRLGLTSKFSRSRLNESLIRPEQPYVLNLGLTSCVKIVCRHQLLWD